MASNYGDGNYGEGFYSGGYLFTPTTRRQVVLMKGSLRYSFQVSPTVWKDANGVWHSQEVPYDGDLVNAQKVITSTGPVEVDQTTANELIAAGIGTIS